MTVKIKNKNLEKSLIFAKLPKKDFTIDVAGLLVYLFKQRYLLTVHQTKSFCESVPLENATLEDNFFSTAKRGVLDVVLEKKHWPKAVRELVKFYDGVMNQKSNKINILLKSAGYVTQWHFDSQDTPSIVLFHQLTGSSMFFGLTGPYGYYFLAKGQSEQLNWKELISHFKKTKGKVKNETVLKGSKKEYVLVEADETLVIFPSGMHQVHVPDDVTKSVAIVLQYPLKELRKKVRKQGFYFEFEKEEGQGKKKRRKN